MFRSSIVLLFVLSLVTAVAAAQTDTITVLHLNDTHANLAPLGPRDAALVGSIGGIARAATVIGMTRMEDPRTLVLHAGDVSIGDLFYTKYFDVAELQILLALGLDAMTLGNHEFDLGPVHLQQMVDTAFAAGSFPLLSANAVMTDPAVAGLAKYVTPYIIKTVGGTKVGIFGLTTPATSLLSDPAPVVFDEDIPGIAAAMVDTLGKRGCAVIICLSHLGAGIDEQVAAAVPGINVIVGGHDHYRLEHPVPVINPANDTTWVLQAESFYKAIGKVRLTRTGSTVRLLDYTYIPLDENIPEEPSTAAAVAGLVAGIEETYGPMYTQRVGYVTADFEEVADSLTVIGPRDTPIAIQAGDSTAHPLHHGPIVGADVFRVVGYGFNADNGLGYHLATFTMTGAALMAGLEFGVSDIENNDEQLLQVSGMTYVYDPSHAPLHRITNVMVGGHPLDPESTYRIAANEFIPMFLDAVGITYDSLVVFSGDTTEFQVLLQTIMERDTVRPTTDGRVRADLGGSTAEGLVGTMPRTYTLSQNYPNPFNPSTTISFSLPVSSMVHLSIFDILGREVASVLSGPCQAGVTNIVWNGRAATGGAVASGVYFYRIEARPNDGSGTFTAVRKMVLMK